MEPLVVLGCLARALAFLHTAPVISEAHVPERARLALAALLALVLAPAGSLPAGGACERLLLEAATGLALGLAVLLPWSTVGALLPQLAAAAGLDGDDEDEPVASRLASAAALACFLALSGDRFLLMLLAAPRHVPAGASDLADLAFRAGGSLFAIAAEGLVPLLAVLAAARLAAALVMRGAALDLSGLHAPALAVAGLVLVAAFLHAAPLLHEDALHEGLVLAGPRTAGPGAGAASGGDVGAAVGARGHRLRLCGGAR